MRKFIQRLVVDEYKSQITAKDKFWVIPDKLVRHSTM